MKLEWSRRTIQSLNCEIVYDEDEKNQIMECLINKPACTLVFFSEFRRLLNFWEELDFINSPKVLIRVIGTSINGVKVDEFQDDNYLGVFIPKSRYLNMKMEVIEIENTIPDQARKKLISPEKLDDKLMDDNDHHQCFIMFQIECDEDYTINGSYFDFDHEVITYKKKVLEILKKR